MLILAGVSFGAGMACYSIYHAMTYWPKKLRVFDYFQAAFHVFMGLCMGLFLDYLMRMPEVP